jgi:catechol 2,3-dioxygenase-like lactoylglutathione lyase family enzyme
MTAVAHVGIAVPDVARARRWYGKVLGFGPLSGDVRVRIGEGHAGKVAADVLGRRAGSFRQTHLTGSNGVALELFEFEHPPDELRGIFHLCVVTPDVARSAARIAASGGRQTSRVWQIFEGEPYLTCYCRDPFGNVIELYSHSHERTYSNRDRPR